jgi:hypothetical protein
VVPGRAGTFSLVLAGTDPGCPARDRDDDALDSVLAYVGGIRREAKRDARFGFDGPWLRFARLMLLLTPQAYGTRMQRYFTEWYGWRTVGAKDDAGDACDGGEQVEVKVSFITDTNAKANFVQIRPWQGIDGYRCFVIDQDLRIWRFDLTKAQMTRELAMLGTVAHGTAGAVEANLNREYAVRLAWDARNGHLQRWLHRYLVWAPAPDDPATDDPATDD